MSYILGLVGALISLIGWFAYESLPMLIIGTVLWLIDTIIEWRNLNAGAKFVDLMLFIIGSVVALFLEKPFYIGGLVAINIYSAIISVLSIPMIIANLSSINTSIDYAFRKIKIKNVKKANRSVPNFSYSDDEIRAYTQRYNNAFLILKDYNNGLFHNVSFVSDQMLVGYIFHIIPLCFGWCTFHANKDKKTKAITEAFRFLDNIIAAAPENRKEEILASMNAMKNLYNNLDSMMVKYKKEVIDPAYLQDRSKENYNKLLADFLKYIFELYPKLKWYDGIVEDFKHCMDEE